MKVEIYQDIVQHVATLADEHNQWIDIHQLQFNLKKTNLLADPV